VNRLRVRVELTLFLVLVKRIFYYHIGGFYRYSLGRLGLHTAPLQAEATVRLKKRLWAPWEAGLYVEGQLLDPAWALYEVSDGPR
jgi:hypothetical protein